MSLTVLIIGFMDALANRQQINMLENRKNNTNLRGSIGQGAEAGGPMRNGSEMAVCAHLGGG